MLLNRRVNFPDYLDLSDWVLLIELRGKIDCELRGQDDSVVFFEIRRDDLNQLSSACLREFIELKAQTAKSSKSTKSASLQATLLLAYETNAA